MALASIYRVVQDLAGNVVTEVLGTITLAGTSTLAALFSDAAGTSPLPNPLVNSATYGSYNVFIGAGSYDMSFLKAGYTFETQRNIVLRDPAAGVNVLTGTANQILLTPTSGIGNVTLSLPQSIAPDSRVQFAAIGLGTPAPTSGLQIVNGNVQSSHGMHVPANSDPSVQGYHTQLASGGSRHAFYAEGDAPSRINGNLGLGMEPIYPLDVTGNTRVTGALGIGTTPAAGGTNLVIAAGKTIWQNTSQVGINADPIYNLQVQGNVGIQRFSRSSNQHGLTIVPDADSGGGLAVVFTNAALSAVGSIATTVSATAYNTSSDGRLKDAIAALPDALATVLALRPVQFKWKADGSPGEGFVAQEVAAVVPRVVSGTPEDETPMGIDFSKLVPYLVGACQTLAQQVETLTARLSALEGAS